MKCANPNCHCSLLYLRGGTLRLLELESAPADRIHGDSSGFPVFRQAARYFWLCSDCSRSFTMKRWTAQGLVLEASAASAEVRESTVLVDAHPAVKPSSVLYFRRTPVRAAG
jgi:hypothetical protein